MLHALFAEVEAVPGQWAQFGLVGTVCGTLVVAVLWFMRHLLTVTFPEMLKTFAAELANERGSRLVQHQDNREDHRQMILAVVELQRTLLERVERLSDETVDGDKETRHAVKTLTAGVTTLIEMLRERGWRPPAKEGGG